MLRERTSVARTIPFSAVIFCQAHPVLNAVVLKRSSSFFLIQSAIKVIVESKLNANGLSALAQLVEEAKFPPNTYICQAGKATPAALYLVRSGTVTIQWNSSKTETIERGGYFGEDQLKRDVGVRSYLSVASPSDTKPDYSAKTGPEEVTVGVLKLAACRKILNTRRIGTPQAATSILLDSLVDKGVALSELKRHTILGAGTFGQVWLVSREASSGKRVAYALKVQSKYELVQDGQAQAVVYEKNIMSELHHPFLIGLVNTYQDDDFVYILLQLIQGGELYNYIHTARHDYLPEKSAKFYAACIAEGLGFMHRRGYVYRDLKPEARCCSSLLRLRFFPPSAGVVGTRPS